MRNEAYGEVIALVRCVGRSVGCTHRILCTREITAWLLQAWLQPFCRCDAHIRLLRFHRGRRTAGHSRRTAFLGSVRGARVDHHRSQGLGTGALRRRLLDVEPRRGRSDGARRSRTRSGSRRSRPIRGSRELRSLDLPAVRDRTPIRSGRPNGQARPPPSSSRPHVLSRPRTPSVASVGPTGRSVCRLARFGEQDRNGPQGSADTWCGSHRYRRSISDADVRRRRQRSPGESSWPEPQNP